MALFRRLFYRKPPDRLLEIADRVYGNPAILSSSCKCREYLSVAENLRATWNGIGRAFVALLFDALSALEMSCSCFFF
jgi:hypothetical protein